MLRGFRFRQQGSYRGVGLWVCAVVLGVTIACGGGDYDDPADSPLAITNSGLSMTIENRAGVPLTDVTIAIVPNGAQTEYSQYFGRIESAERREISFAQFNGSDGTPFSLRTARPRSVKVMAKDINGESYDIELPWEN